MSGVNTIEDDRNWVVSARSRLALRRAQKPATKAAQIRALWPDIDAALAGGQSMKTICGWLADDAGIALSVSSLTSYVSRIRRREDAKRYAPLQSPSASFSTLPRTTTGQSRGPIPPADAKLTPAIDPLANLHSSQAKRRTFNYRPPTEDDAKDLI